MKIFFSFCLPVFMVVSGCKKETTQQDLCVGVVCLNGGECENGVCVCPGNYTGTNCQLEIIPIDSFIGNYHLAGYTHSWFAGSDTTIWIDEVRTVTKLNDSTLSIKGEALSFTKMFAADSVNFYNYMWVYGAGDYSRLSFHRPFIVDSAYYIAESGGLGGGNYTNLVGIKIH